MLLLRYLLLCMLLLLNIHESRQGPYETEKPTNHEAWRAPAAEDSSENFFDNTSFDPRFDPYQLVFKKLHKLWRQDLNTLEKTANKDSVMIDVLKRNIAALEDFFKAPAIAGTTACVKSECTVYADIDKSKQMMYLYVYGERSDSFAVSTGMPGYTTPDMDLQPSGPLFIKYTSTKFPEGDYQGMGNMPYAVFIRGGYAIHGTTPGSFSKLGTPASHGCIRLHPDNAKIFFDLVTTYGLENSWVTIRN